MKFKTILYNLLKVWLWHWKSFFSRITHIWTDFRFNFTRFQFPDTRYRSSSHRGSLLSSVGMYLRSSLYNVQLSLFSREWVHLGIYHYSWQLKQNLLILLSLPHPSFRSLPMLLNGSWHHVDYTSKKKYSILWWVCKRLYFITVKVPHFSRVFIYISQENKLVDSNPLVNMLIKRKRDCYIFGITPRPMLTGC